MPTYKYRCDVCSKDFEHVQTMADKPLKKVPMTGPCGEKCKSTCTKVFTVPGINLRQGKANVTRQQNATVTDHWDGRRDVTVSPDPVGMSAGFQNNPNAAIGSESQRQRQLDDAA